MKDSSQSLEFVVKPQKEKRFCPSILQQIGPSLGEIFLWCTNFLKTDAGSTTTKKVKAAAID